MISRENKIYKQKRTDNKIQLDQSLEANPMGKTSQVVLRCPGIEEASRDAPGVAVSCADTLVLLKFGVETPGRRLLGTLTKSCL